MDAARVWADQVLLLKRRANSVLLTARVTADGVVSLDPTCPSSREALLGPAGTACTSSGVVVAMDGLRQPACTQRGGLWPTLVALARTDWDRTWAGGLSR